MAKSKSRKKRAAPGSSTARARPRPVVRPVAPFNPEQQFVDEAKAAVAAEHPDLEVQAGRVVRKYSALERDKALLEVQTDKGFYEVILGRDGSKSIFAKE
jgi:hypothetical protein